MLLGVRSVQQLYGFKSSFKNRELMSEKITVTFYALGDSLTVGYQSPTPEVPFIHNRPYTVYLGSLAESLLNGLQLNHIAVRFVNAGVNGDTTEGMLSRFSRDVAQKKPSYVIVWGGINDLYYERKPEKVMYNLAKLWRKAEEIGAKCIACTLAPVEDNPSINELVRQTNRMIIDSCKANDMLCVDMYSALVDNEGKLAHRFSNDTLHLTTEGYEAVAQAIFQEAIRKILETSNSQLKSSGKKRQTSWTIGKH